MKTKKLLPLIISMLLFGVVIAGATMKHKPAKTEENQRVSEKARYTFSLQLFQTF